MYFPKHPVTNQRQAFCFVTFSTRKVTACYHFSLFHLYCLFCFQCQFLNLCDFIVRSNPRLLRQLVSQAGQNKAYGCLQAANVAVSQSNRKINGQLVSSIAATADRPMHHRAGRPAAPTPSTPEAINMQPQLCHAYAKAALEPHHLSVAALQQALAGHNVWPGQASFAPFTQPIPVRKLCQYVPLC